MKCEILSLITFRKDVSWRLFNEAVITEAAAVAIE
jgi:hypothetical protein